VWTAHDSAIYCGLFAGGTGTVRGECGPAPVPPNPTVSLQAKAVRRVLRAAFLCHLFVVLGWTSTASATSVVIKVEKDRIILAADTRRKAMSSGAPNSSDFHDDYCKITTLGKAGFAVAGYADHNEKSPAGQVDWSWAAFDDARTSYGLHPNDIIEMADDWRAREIRLFSTLYVLHQDLVKELAGADGATPLLIGHFAGWDNEGRPTLILEIIALYQGQAFGLLNPALTPTPSLLNPIYGYRSVLYERPLPYSTNNHTENLIESDPAQSIPIAKKWSERAKAKKFPKSDLDWRWVEFLIQSTNAYDETVGKDTDVLEVRASGSKWLHNGACATRLKLQKPVPLH
jgi:hypothetical protein